jgi:thiamine-monophosphate kinase
VKLGDLGEDALVARLLRGLPVGSNVIAGPGDDCAIIGRPRDRRWTLLKTDCVIEGIHFTAEADARRVGWKALCRAISDIAAMAGKPRHALLTVAASREVKLAWMEALYAGIRRAARLFEVGIVGGETSRSPGTTFINVALTGEVDRERCLQRSGARAGDQLYVTGVLGGSISARHLDVIPRIAEAQWLARYFPITAMMDLSDGLASDLPRLAEASGCSFEIDETAIPLQRGCTVEQALTDGEDYELLFAISARKAAALENAWSKRFKQLRLTRIGELTPRTKQQKPFAPRGYDHFAPGR